jgi:hypothetical protein
MVAQVSDRGSLGLVIEDDVGDEALVAWAVFPDKEGAVTHAGAQQQRCFDFA